MKPYYADDAVTLYRGDMREVLPALDVAPDCIIADPPYGETSLAWDRWPDGWVQAAADVTNSMWCFGSMRMFLARHGEFDAAGWRFASDAVWHKNTGSSRATDRPRRVHEHAVHWYRGPWRDIHHEVPRVPAPPTLSARPLVSGTEVHKRAHVQHTGHYAASVWTDDGTRLLTSVIFAKNLRGLAQHPTEKPQGILTPLIEYACPPGGTVLDPFAGSGSTAVAARLSGRRAVLIEADERYCETIARRLAQDVLPITA